MVLIRKEEIQNNRIEIKFYRKRDKVEAAQHLRAFDSCKQMDGWQEMHSDGGETSTSLR